MAKRYIKIGWENKPSVKTPVNMANLGRMDKGIDDCDNAIEEIYSKRVNNVVTTNKDTFLAGPVGKFLQDQVTELNKNLTNLYAFFAHPLRHLGVVTAIDTVMDDYGGGASSIVYTCTEGYNFLVLGFERNVSNVLYGSQLRLQFNTGNLEKRFKTGEIWGAWAVV